jgi:hypothetical protein
LKLVNASSPIFKKEQIKGNKDHLLDGIPKLQLNVGGLD